MNLSTIEKEAINKINSVKDLDELEKNRLFYLGKKGIISQEMNDRSTITIDCIIHFIKFMISCS